MFTHDSISKEQKNYIVKDTITGEKYEMPPLWIDALAMMRDGFIGEIEEKLKEEYPSEEVNMLAFTRQLLELELVEMVDGEEIACTKKRDRLFSLGASSCGTILS